jgi:hypothetical protein
LSGVRGGGGLVECEVNTLYGARARKTTFLGPPLPPLLKEERSRGSEKHHRSLI